MIQQILRIYDVVDQFLKKPFWFSQRIFLNSDWIQLRNRAIINLSRCCYKNYTSVVLNDSEVTFLGKVEDAAFHLFLFGVLFIDNIA